MRPPLAQANGETNILIIRRTGTGLANSWQVVATALIPPDRALPIRYPAIRPWLAGDRMHRALEAWYHPSIA